ncbi:hypothetical protein CROQUDRAFT_661839 [Cronartium quercuum f. sp. fusiforme G11]|uniref:FUN14 family protein n=1 Tax=Cronartium quercuum f. sp. fusiforme G11 TaxID=708437 RepID=A0A9P6NBN6_9BASI|nr:hypothetical protein CROQUDRAFT_661839 [Cronartium quercuum f. sp. fusiforme G11]
MFLRPVHLMNRHLSRPFSFSPNKLNRVSSPAFRPPPLTNYRWLTVGACTSATTIAFLTRPIARADDKPIVTRPGAVSPPPESILSLQKLSFGTVSGICVGVFIRKGLRLLACLFGAGFVFLQYLHSRSFVDVHWSRMERVYDRQRGKGIGERFWTFITADFQARSSFSIGLVLGLRIG